MMQDRPTKSTFHFVFQKCKGYFVARDWTLLNDTHRCSEFLCFHSKIMKIKTEPVMYVIYSEHMKQDSTLLNTVS